MKAVVFFGLTVTLLAGCFSSSVRYYALQDGQTQGQVNAVNVPDRRVGVSIVSLPKLLNRPQLVVRVSNSEVRFEERHQWGGRLQEEISQLIVTELQALHSQDSVYLYPADNRLLPTQQWSADILQLDGEIGRKVILRASCRLLDKNSRVPVFERSVQLGLQTQGGEFTDYVNTQRELIRQFARACAW